MKRLQRFITLFLTVMTVMIFIACGSSEKTYSLTGAWKTDSGRITEITFNEDGTGNLKKGSEISVDFTYVLEEGKVTVTTEVLGQKSSTEYTYTVTADKLTLTDSYGSTEYSHQ